MSKPRQAKILTLVILGCAFAAVLWQRSGWRAPLSFPKPTAESSPQDTIYSMLDAARKGDTSGYLSAYTGAMESSIRRAMAEQTEDGFAEYLRRSNAAIKGIAIMAPEALTDSEVRVRVEYVYEDRNEAQFMYLEKTGDSWKIARVEAAQRVKTLIPYGTPVE